MRYLRGLPYMVGIIMHSTSIPPSLLYSYSSCWTTLGWHWSWFRSSYSSLYPSNWIILCLHASVATGLCCAGVVGVFSDRGFCLRNLLEAHALSKSVFFRFFCREQIISCVSFLSATAIVCGSCVVFRGICLLSNFLPRSSLSWGCIYGFSTTFRWAN